MKCSYNDAEVLVSGMTFSDLKKCTIYRQPGNDINIVWLNIHDRKTKEGGLFDQIEKNLNFNRFHHLALK